MKRLLTSFGITLICFVLLARAVFAEECSPSCNGLEECQKKIEECSKLLKLSSDATRPHEERAKELENNIAAIEGNMNSLAAQIEKKKMDIGKGEVKLAEREDVFSGQVRQLYKKDYQSPVEAALGTFLSGANVGESMRLLAYRQNLLDQEKDRITAIVGDISGLLNAKKQLEESQKWMAAKRDELEITLGPVKKLVTEAKAYQSQLSQTVGSLSVRQEQLLAEKTGNFVTSVGDVPPSDDPASSPSYNPGFSPAFAGFSFGAPHRKGMSQYGAYGRAKSGQNADQILKAYYGSGIEIKKDYNTGININVDGYGSFNIEDYTKRIYEMPNSWGDNNGFEALKAQAVAARSYALARTNNGANSICATEACQVFQPNEKGGNWSRAVDETRGWVLVTNGQPFSAYYAASSGGFNYGYSAQGYSSPGGWDTKCGSQSCWTADAYEKISGSPWFYKAWYKPRGGSASRPHPWLNKDEFSDIVNAVIMYKKDGGSLSHLGQTDKSNPDTWSKDELKNRLGGDGVSSVSSVSVSYSGNGYTGGVHVETDKGGKDFSGEDFREIFNIRAPGEIYLPSALFNIEKK